jgi:hypothetical protein
MAEERQRRKHGKWLFSQIGLLEDLIHGNKDSTSDPVLLAGPIGSVPATGKSNMAPLLHMDIGTEQGERGMTDGSPDMLPSPNQARVECQSVQVLILERGLLPSSQGIFGDIILLQVPEPPLPEWGVAGRLQSKRSHIS